MPIGLVQAPDEPLLYGFGGYDMAVSDSQVFVVFEQQQQGIFLARSNDRGDTFGSPTSVQGAVPGGYAILSAATVDGTGNPVVSYIQYKNGKATYQLRRSPDGGFNFDESVIGNAPAPGGAVCECCTSDLLASGDSIWLLFRNNNQDLRDIWVSRSTDLAALFDIATDVDSTDWHLNFCPIAGPRMARAGDSLITVWMSGASGTGRVYCSTLHAGTMEAGQQMDFPTPLDPQISQGQADVTALGDTVGVIFVEKSIELVFHFSIKGVSDLANHASGFAIPDHTLQLPSLAFRNGVFHLVYADATSGQVLYRQGKVTQSSQINEPIDKDRSHILIHPNPSKGEILLESTLEPFSALRLMNAQGKLLRFFDGSLFPGNMVSMDLRPYPTGVYFVQVKVKDAWEWHKIMKY